LSEIGAIRQQKRLHYVPSAVCAYAGPQASAAEPPRHHLLLGTHTAALAVYREMGLAWSATVPSVPIAIRIGRFGSVPSSLTD
jgi:hypothetical protein